MRRVTGVKVVKPYILQVSFVDGTVRKINVEPILWGPVFEPLRDPKLFSQVYVDPELDTVAWPNGADVDPEWLYSASEEISAAAAQG